LEALVFAAGRGERMLPLTRACPKALLPVDDRPLIEHLLGRLREAGIRDIVINVSHLGDRIEAALGDGSRLGLAIRYSREPEEPLETGGGMRQALELLRGERFVAANADVWSDYAFDRLHATSPSPAHLVLVDNPPHHPGGDFALPHGSPGPVALDGNRLTFAGIGIYHRGFIEHHPPGRFRLAPLLRAAASTGSVTGEHFQGCWIDVGTPERLSDAERAARKIRLRAARA